MEWLLGGGAVAGVLTGAAAFWTLFVMARAQRQDANELREAQHGIDEARLLQERTERALEVRDATIQSLQGELARERAARAAADKQVGDLLADLAAHGDPTGAGERIRRSFRLLAELSGVPQDASGDRGEAPAVHGPDVDPAGDAGRPIDVPGPIGTGKGRTLRPPSK